MRHLFSDRPTDTQLTRREWMKLSAMGAVGYSLSGWFCALANETASHPDRREIVHPPLDERRPQPDRTPSTSSRAMPTAGRSRA